MANEDRIDQELAERTMRHSSPQLSCNAVIVVERLTDSIKRHARDNELCSLGPVNEFGLVRHQNRIARCGRALAIPQHAVRGHILTQRSPRRGAAGPPALHGTLDHTPRDVH